MLLMGSKINWKIIWFMVGLFINISNTLDDDEKGIYDQGLVWWHQI